MRFIIGSRSYGYLWIACSVTLVIPAAGPRGEIRRGNSLSMNLSLSYWGSNSCRSGWIASSFRDLPAAAADYIANFAGL
jgi:hypothetical protein